MSKHTPKSVNNFDVLKAMSARDLDIRFGPDILRVQKTKAGTQVTVGIGGDVVAAIADGRLSGGLMLWDVRQYQQVSASLARNGDSESDLLAELKNLCEKVARLEGVEIPYPVAIPIGLALKLAEAAIAKAESGS